MTWSALIRDIAIIIIAVQSIVIGVLIGILIWQVWRLVKTLQTEVMPIIQETRETISTVKGTTTFISDNIVSPVAKTSGYVAGTRQTLKTLAAGLGRSKSGKPGKKITPP